MYITQNKHKNTKSQRAITQKQKSTLIVRDTSSRSDIHSIKFYEDILNGYRVMGRTRFFLEKISKEHNLETKKGGTILLARHTLFT